MASSGTYLCGVFIVVTILAVLEGGSAANYVCEKPSDVVFLMDTSNSIWRPDFEKQLDFVRALINKFTVGKDFMRIGAVAFSEYTRLQFHLDRYFKKSDIKKAVGRIRQNGGVYTFTGDAIHYMRTRSFREDKGARKNTTKIGIIITDGRSYNRNITAAEAQLAKDEGIHLFAIGVGHRVDELELEMIASEPTGYYSFMVENYDSLKRIKDLLAEKTCTVTDPPTTTTTTTTPTPTTTTTSTPGPLTRLLSFQTTRSWPSIIPFPSEFDSKIPQAQGGRGDATMDPPTRNWNGLPYGEIIVGERPGDHYSIIGSGGHDNGESIPTLGNRTPTSANHIWNPDTEENDSERSMEFPGAMYPLGPDGSGDNITYTNQNPIADNDTRGGGLQGPPGNPFGKGPNDRYNSNGGPGGPGGNGSNKENNKNGGPGGPGGNGGPGGPGGNGPNSGNNKNGGPSGPGGNGGPGGPGGNGQNNGNNKNGGPGGPGGNGQNGGYDQNGGPSGPGGNGPNGGNNKNGHGQNNRNSPNGGPSGNNQNGGNKTYEGSSGPGGNGKNSGNNPNGGQNGPGGNDHHGGHPRNGGSGGNGQNGENGVNEWNEINDRDRGVNGSRLDCPTCRTNDKSSSNHKGHGNNDYVRGNCPTCDSDRDYTNGKPPNSKLSQNNCRKCNSNKDDFLSSICPTCDPKKVPDRVNCVGCPPLKNSGNSKKKNNNKGNKGDNETKKRRRKHERRQGLKNGHGYAGPGCMPHVPTDVVFVVDSKIGGDSYQRYIWKFVRDIVSRLDMAKNLFRIQFVHECMSVPDIKLDMFETKSELLGELQHAIDTPRRTASLFRSMSGKIASIQEPFKDRRKVGIYITDDHFLDVDDTMLAAQEAKDQFGVELYSVGVGGRISPTELRRVASSNDKKHVYLMSHHAKLPKVARHLSKELCRSKH